MALDNPIRFTLREPFQIVNGLPGIDKNSEKQPSCRRKYIGSTYFPHVEQNREAR